ncbi:hypothetical protein DCAR_0102869 [Daucus carota subsp. sativus]|uniref:G domain-containing protein n=1 Tax=Daucus carota subsp. sativus TaxID=79200 RepID=A0AAF0W5Q7_DAUCS|nr:PREDICTED: probable transmembrane GTPase FZO-like, chloroplastic [Daucus carota subsp. sativus]WOG83692.1 hypothetical protein DCAR_0102869 [Daucus carota subsp. sativus]
MVLSLHSHSTSINTHLSFLFHRPNRHLHPPHHLKLRRHFSVTTAVANNSTSSNQQPRTLFPGGYKRPQIKVPALVLQLNPQDVLVQDNRDVLSLIDDAVSKNWIGIVVLNDGGDASGGKMYEAACLLKSFIGGRAYLLLSERVDIAAAVNASGVLLSDQGLPAIVARKTITDAKFESAVLPLVARNVQTPVAAENASNSEGADFLIYNVDGRKPLDEVVDTVFGRIKIPIFILTNTLKDDELFGEASRLMKAGASGLVISLNELKVLSDDVLYKMFKSVNLSKKRQQEILPNLADKLRTNDASNGSFVKEGVVGFVNLEDKVQKLMEREKSVLTEAIDVIKRAAPLTDEVSLLVDAVLQLDEPFLLVIVGEFNSGKSTFINALLGEKYLQDGVVPTTNEITFLRYSGLDSSEQQRCERHPDGQFVCYLPAPILKEMIIVDTPGTNVILQRQQRLTEEFVPRADLLLFVISADRPLTESEVTFLRYTQQWKKKVVFVLNKSDIYQNATELEEAISFIKENTKRLLNTEHVTLYPVSARAALKAKLLASSNVHNKNEEISVDHSQQRTSGFYELEEFLLSFLDGSTSTGIERIKLKLETPIRIAEQLLAACQIQTMQDYQQAKQDLMSVNELLGSVEDYAQKMESESILWRRKTLSLIDDTKSRALKLTESTLVISNIDIVTTYVFRGNKGALVPAASVIQNDIIGPALSEAQKLLGDYVTWLQSNNAREGRSYLESFKKKWPSIVNTENLVELETDNFLGRKYELSREAIESFNAAAASKLFDQEVREAFIGSFGGLGAAGLSASLLTSVLPTTLEDLLALALCSAGGLLAISKFPARRQLVVDKVKRTADALGRELEEAMLKDLVETTESLKNFVKLIGKPYQDLAQHRLENLLATQEKLSSMESTIKTLQIENQNLHIS